jgi:beta-galactosidase/beta-glucuronidase
MMVWENAQAEVLPLDGAWEFALREQTGTIHVPGCWEAQGYAHRVDGPAVYRRVVAVPAGWAGQRVQLQFDAVSYYAEVSVNGTAVGTHRGTWTAFAFDVTGAIHPDEDNEIAVTVWKPGWETGSRFPLRGSLAGFLPDVFVMFGGIWQAARLVAFPGAALSDVSVLLDARSDTVRLAAAAHQAGARMAVVNVRGPDEMLAVRWRGPVKDGEIAATLTIPNPVWWGLDRPARYTAEIRIEGDAGAVVRRSFGFRALTNQGDQLLFNGETVMLRGALNWGWYPDIVCPAPNDETIRDEFRRIRELGFNMMKLCLYVPSPRYFEIADEEGMFLWLELPLWLPHVTPEFEQRALTEYAEIVAAVQHHPSIIVYSLGCELGADVNPDWLEALNAVVRGRVNDVLVCDNSGSGEAYGCVADLADFEDYHFYTDIQFFDQLVDHFGQRWPTTLVELGAESDPSAEEKRDRRAGRADETRRYGR